MPIRILLAGAERLDDIEDVWHSLHEHHLAVDHGRNAAIRERRQTWQLRRADFAHALAQPDAFLILASDEDAEGLIAGFALVHFHENDNWRVHGDRYAELDSLAVLPGYRGHGLGRKLMAAVYGRVRELGVAEISFLVVEQNTEARRFYEKEGFLPWHVTYFGPVPEA